MFSPPSPSALGSALRASAPPREALLLVLALLLPACGPKNFTNQNDELRRSNLELNREVEALEKKLALRTDEVQALHQQLNGSATGSATQPGVAQPTLARVEIGRYSGPVDADGDGHDDLIRLYLRTLDGQGRMFPLPATALVGLLEISDHDAPRLLASSAWDQKEFDASYREGFTGTHYTLELPLPPRPDRPIPDALIRVSVTDARTGTNVTVQQTYPLR